MVEDDDDATPGLDARLARAEAVVRRNVLWALGAGAVPVPGVDLLAIIGVQVKLLRELGAVYGLPPRDDRARKLVAALLAGLGGVGVGALLGSSLIKLLPGLGTAIAIAAVPAVAGACTHATGRVFVLHLESGGTFLDFNPRRYREHFRAEFAAERDRVTHAPATIKPPGRTSLWSPSDPAASEEDPASARVARTRRSG